MNQMMNQEKMKTMTKIIQLLIPRKTWISSTRFLLIKKQDPKLKEKDVKLFDSESDDESESEGEGEEEEGGNKKKKKKAMYLKDVMTKHLIEEGAEFDEEVDEKKKRTKNYVEEQEELRKAFLEAAKEVEDDDEEEEGYGFLKERKKEKNDEEDVDDGDDDEFVQKLDEYFGRDGDTDENKMFLKEFFKNQMWKEKKDKEVGIDGDEVEDLLREEELLERQEQYEINYRHEEVVDDRIMGYSRKVEGSVRKVENARKQQRKSKEERMRIAEMERKEELKHLKNLKKKEMKKRMKKVMEIAGFKEDEDLPLNLKNMDDEFDPEEYDKMMKATFDDKYYGDEDVDPEFGRDREDDDSEIDKPDFDKENELLGLPKGWDVIESGDGFKAARERSLKHKLENGGGDDDEEEDEEEEESEGGEDEEVSEESKRKKKRKMSLVKRAKEEMLEEIYKMDYEDTVGDLKTRFKYAKVKPNRYGLKTEEVFMLGDKELNQYVPVKKLAPYREEEWKLPDSQRYQLKLKVKELIEGKSDRKSGKKRSIDKTERSTSEMGSKGDEKAQVEEPNGDTGKLSKRAKTRRLQSKLKPSHSRLIAYGKIASKAKSKEKH